MQDTDYLGRKRRKGLKWRGREVTPGVQDTRAPPESCQEPPTHSLASYFSLRYRDRTPNSPLTLRELPGIF